MMACVCPIEIGRPKEARPACQGRTSPRWNMNLLRITNETCGTRTARCDLKDATVFTL